MKVGQNEIKPTVHIHPVPSSAGWPTVTAWLRCPPPHPQQQQLHPWAQALAEHLWLYWVLYPRPLQQQTGSLASARSSFNNWWLSETFKMTQPVPSHGEQHWPASTSEPLHSFPSGRRLPALPKPCCLPGRRGAAPARKQDGKSKLGCEKQQGNVPGAGHKVPAGWELHLQHGSLNAALVLCFCHTTSQAIQVKGAF